jgi:hypothetical protein
LRHVEAVQAPATECSLAGEAYPVLSPMLKHCACAVLQKSYEHT